MKKYAVIFSMLCLSACSVKLMVPTQADADRGAQKFGNYSLADLNKGKAIFTDHCGACHRYKKPESRNEMQWNKIVPRMAKKAKLDSLSRDLVLKYVVTMSEAKRNGKKS